MRINQIGIVLFTILEHFYLTIYKWFLQECKRVVFKIYLQRLPRLFKWLISSLIIDNQLRLNYEEVIHLHLFNIIRRDFLLLLSFLFNIAKSGIEFYYLRSYLLTFSIVVLISNFYFTYLIFGSTNIKFITHSRNF